MPRPSGSTQTCEEELRREVSLAYPVSYIPTPGGVLLFPALTVSTGDLTESEL
jgi:hypothetical protein